MNIFYLSTDPKECAKWHNDKHVVKMIIEYAQLMSTAHRMLDGELWYDKTSNGRRIARWKHPIKDMDDGLMKASHVNHPSAVWVRQSYNNYMWLYYLWRELLKEYTYRYGKHHACEKYAVFLQDFPKNIPAKDKTPPPPAMKAFPECIVPHDSITSYRNYYMVAKRSFNNWSKREVPHWYE